MKWKNLKDGRCPKCGNMLAQSADAMTLSCPNRQCGYYISAARMQEIITSPARSSDIDPEDNLARHEY